MMSREKTPRNRAEPLVLERLREVVAGLGPQKIAAEKCGLPYATLQRMIAGKSPLDHDRLAKIASAAGVTVDYILRRTDELRLVTAVQGEADLSAVAQIPRLAAVASAGNGATVESETLLKSPFHLEEAWLRARFGTVSTLRVVQVSGASQEPDLSNGDWVLIDEAKNAIEDGLAVVRHGDGLLVKRLLREEHSLYLLSKNPEYPPIYIDLLQEEDQFKVIGKVVYSFRGI